MNTAQYISRFWTDGALRESAAQTRAALEAVDAGRVRSIAALSKAAQHYAGSWQSAATLDAAHGTLSAALSVELGDTVVTQRSVETARGADSAVDSLERVAVGSGARLALQVACRLARLAVEMAHQGRHGGALAAICELAERLPEPLGDPRAENAVRAVSVLAASLPNEGGQR